MPRFSDLPMDLLPYILDYLSKKEYHALIRVCKSLYKDVLPHLYRDISFRASKSRGCARKLAFLLRTILEKPQLASYVTCFRLFGPHPSWTKFNPWPEENESSTINLWGLEGCTTLTRAQKIFASNQFYQLVDEEMHKSTGQFRGRVKDALATLVLTRFTQLKTLELGDGFLMYSLFLPQVLKRADRLFPKLEHITFGDRRPDPENAVSYVDLDLIRPVFYLTTVTNFGWTMSQPWHFQWNRPDAPRSESLTQLHLFRANIHRATLGAIITAAPKLKHLTYEQEILFKAFIPPNDLTPFTSLEGLNVALSTVQGTLEEIKLCLRLAPGSLSEKKILEDGLRFPPIQGTLKIREMKNLTKVQIPMILILGWYPDFAARLEEVLPPGIETLTLRDDFVNFCPWALGFDCFKKIGLLGEYIAGRQKHAPQLRTFKIRLRKPRNNMWLDDAIADMNAPIFGEGVSHSVTQGQHSETHSWNFRSPDESPLPSTSAAPTVLLPASRYESGK